MLGVGPEWVHLRQNRQVTNSVAGEVAGDFMYWPDGRHRFGWFLEPGLRLQLCRRPPAIHRHERRSADRYSVIVTRHRNEERCGGRNELREFFELGEVVEVVAGHGFDDGLEGHGAALGMRDGLAGCLRQSVLNEEQVPVAQGGERGEGLRCRDSRIGGGPFFLIEGLDDVIVLGQRLAQAEAEGQFAIGQVRGDLGRAPFARRGRSGDLSPGRWS